MISFAKHLNLVDQEAFFIAVDGEHEGLITLNQTNDFIIKLKMKEVEGITFEKQYDFLDTGSPHAVIFLSEIDNIDVVAEGRKLRYNRTFAEVGTNVDFVEIIPEGLKVRTYERGVENETLSCGTGVVASVLAYAERNPDLKSPCRVETKGGLLSVHFSRNTPGFSNIWLEGPASFVFKGEIEVL